MATHNLSADTLLSSLLPSGGGSLASGDTIDFNGHTLVMDCDAVDYPFTPANAGGTECRLELRDLSRIKLNASLPATVHPWVDPAHPLPVSDPDHAIDGDPYRTTLTANARAEIQLSGPFGLGGGAADLPTETRSGNFWAIVHASPAANKLSFDRDFPLHAGDILICLSQDSLSPISVSSWDAGSKTATFQSNVPIRTAGAVYGLVAGGVLIRQLSLGQEDGALLSADVRAGTLNLYSAVNNYYTSHLRFGFKGCNLSADRVAFLDTTSVYSAAQAFLHNATATVGQCICTCLCPKALNGLASCVYADIGELCTRYFIPANAVIAGRIRVLGGMICTSGQNAGLGLHVHFKATKNGIAASAAAKSSCRCENCTGDNVPEGDCLVLPAGTVTRTARTGFPADTDLPDAQFHAPNAADAVTWRHEDRWVRKGETLRMRARWMPAGAGARASVAVTELATWWPDLWPLGAEALAAREFAGSAELQWTGGGIAWRNDTGEDCQVRVWECVTGDTLGGYLRVWEATGGAM